VKNGPGAALPAARSGRCGGPGALPRSASLLASLLATLLLGLALAGCQDLADADQSRICRTLLPALNPPGTRINIVHASTTEPDHALRIVYRAEPPDEPARTRFASCQFSGEGLARNKQELVGVRTDLGRLSGVSMLFLRRFYLADPTSVLEDPGDPAYATRPIPVVGPGVAFAAQNLINALPQIGVYGLVAAAYSLIYGLVGRIVFGFGEFASLGGYGALIGVTICLQLAVTSPVLALAVGFAVALGAALMHGVVAGRLVVAPLVRRGHEEVHGLPVLIATTGLMITLSEYQRLLQGSELRWLPPVLNAPVPLLRAGDFITTVTPIALLATGITLVAGTAVLALMRFTGFGRQWRALSDDAGTAALFGVDRHRVFAGTFALAAGLAGFAGFIVTAYYGAVGYGYGLSLGLKALVAAVVGGIGSVGGAFAGGVVIALAEVAWSATMPIESRDIAIYALLSIMLALRPGGLFGFRDLLPRRV
jgi:branched-chain amino acid transport system permease protein